MINHMDLKHMLGDQLHCAKSQVQAPIQLYLFERAPVHTQFTFIQSDVTEALYTHANTDACIVRKQLSRMGQWQADATTAH